MNYVEYGKENSDVFILLHGGGLSWWNYKEVAERLQTDYHVVLPILDGHAGCDKQFTTIENNALDIIEFVNSKLGGSVLVMGGLSLGGQILLEILSQRKEICKYAIVESVLVIPSKFTYSMIKPAFQKLLETAKSQLGATASLGTTISGTKDTDFESLLKAADAEMYENKKQYYIVTGKDRRKHSL